MEDDYLENHVIKSLMVDNKDQCELRCYAENFCSSFNLGISETRGKLKCELSDSDHFQHPEHLICKKGFSYHPTMVGILQRKGKPKIYSYLLFLISLFLTVAHALGTSFFLSPSFRCH